MGKAQKIKAENFKICGMTRKSSMVVLAAALSLLYDGSLKSKGGVTPFVNAIRVLADGTASDETIQWALHQFGSNRALQTALDRAQGAMIVLGFNGSVGVACLGTLLGGYDISFGKIAGE